MSRARTIFFCFKCEKQGFCDREQISEQRNVLLTKWRNSNFVLKTFTSKPIDRLFETEAELFKRCESDLNLRAKNV